MSICGRFSTRWVAVTSNLNYVECLRTIYRSFLTYSTCILLESVPFLFRKFFRNRILLILRTYLSQLETSQLMHSIWFGEVFVCTAFRIVLFLQLPWEISSSHFSYLFYVDKFTSTQNLHKMDFQCTLASLRMQYSPLRYCNFLSRFYFV